MNSVDGYLAYLVRHDLHKYAENAQKWPIMHKPADNSLNLQAASDKRDCVKSSEDGYAAYLIMHDLLADAPLTLVRSMTRAEIEELCPSTP